MEWLLAQAGATAVSFATRGGYSLATHYAVKTVKRFMEKVPEEDRQGLEKTRQRLETKILIISPAIDLIQLISARGNTSLKTTVALTRELKADIDDFQRDMDMSMDNASQSVAKVRESMELLLKRVEEAIPLIQLALTTSGACLSADLPNNVSPGKLLQAMDYTKASERNPSNGDIQIGPCFEIKSYTTFSSTSQIAWKEDMARGRLSLFQKQKFNYYMKLEESFDDNRYHDDDERPRVTIIDVSKITRLFFSASGKLLEIEDSKSPVLVVKVNHADLDVFDDDEDEEEKVTWLALENWTPCEYHDDEFDLDNSFDMSVTEDSPRKVVEESPKKARDSRVNNLSNQLSNLNIDTAPESISLLEYLLRLLALQSNDQKSALEITDERLNLYLRDESRASNYEQPVPAHETQRTLDRPIAPDTPIVLGGKKSSLARNLLSRGNVQAPASVTRPSSAAPQTPLRNTQFSSFHTPNTRSAWEVDRVMRPSPLKRPH